MELHNGPVEEILINFCGCPHLSAAADALKSNYHLILAYYVTCLAEEASKRKATDAYCRICKAKNRIHACLECAFFGCFDLREFSAQNDFSVYSHMKCHARNNGHWFSININHGCVFCHMCNDYVYNETFEDILNDYAVEARRIDGSQSYLPWKPKAKEIALLKNKIKKISDDSYIGLRGIANNRYSCYINCVIQIFIHNPVLRDFFLTDQHKCFKKNTDSCLTCEMFVLFQEFYSGITLPYYPMNFFQVFRKFWSENLGESQHDTFELYQEILKGLQSSCQETHEPDNCNCLIHKTFYGISQNSKECSQCYAVSPFPIDHFIDILLDLKGKNDSLVEILKRKFFIPELLFDYKCSTCKAINTTYLSLSIKKLPAVICFRMNCFNYLSGTDLVKKKSTAFAFEDSIDMSEYLYSKDNRSDIPDSRAIVLRYYLFGIIYHKGQTVKGGHYVTYVKQRRNQWFECDDVKISKRSVKEVFECEPFLLFYYKQL